MANVSSFVPKMTAVASSRSTSKVVPCGESRQTDGAPRGCPMAARSCSWIATPHAAFIVAADGGEAPRRILETELSRTIWTASAIHPEGRLSVFAPKVAAGFFVADRTHSRLNAVDTSAAAPLGLLEPDVIRNISWNPAGTALIVEALSDGVPTLWRVPVEPVSLRWRTPERLTTAPASAQGAAVSPDGTRVAFTSAPASTRAWLFPFDANSARLTGDGRALTADDISIVSLRLAADGSALCYGALEAGRKDYRLFHTDLTTGSTTFLADAFEGAISRSGRRVAYLLTRTRSTSTGAETPATGHESALAVRDLDGREHLVSRWGRGGMLPRDWAPDDKAVLGSWLEQGQMEQNVLAIWPIGPMMATRPERVILESSGVNFWQARYSPDGQWVSFVAQRMRNPGNRRDRHRCRAQQSRHDVDADRGRSCLARQAPVVTGWADAVLPLTGS